MPPSPPPRAASASPPGSPGTAPAAGGLSWGPLAAALKRAVIRWGLSARHRGAAPRPRLPPGKAPRGSLAPGTAGPGAAAAPGLVGDPLGPPRRPLGAHRPPPRPLAAALTGSGGGRGVAQRSAAAQPGREGRRVAARSAARCPRSAGGRAAAPHRTAPPPPPPPAPARRAAPRATAAPSAPAPLTWGSRCWLSADAGSPAPPCPLPGAPLPGSRYGRVPAEPSPHRRGRPAPQELRR